MTDTPKHIADDDFRDLEDCNPHYVSPQEAAEESGDWEGDGLTGSAPRADYPPVVTVKPLAWFRWIAPNVKKIVALGVHEYSIKRTGKGYVLKVRGSDGKRRCIALCDTLDEAKAAAQAHHDAAVMSAIDVQPTWRGMDSAPKDGTEIIAYREDQGVFTCRYAHMAEFVDMDLYVDEEWGTSDNEGFWHEGSGWLDGDLMPTHWTPLPSPPSEGA